MANKQHWSNAIHIMTSNRVFPVFMSITLGLHKYPELLPKGLVCHQSVSDKAWKMMHQIDVYPERTELDLVVVSGTDLGFTRPTRRTTIYARAQELGLQLCPAEVGPALRLAWDMPPDSGLIVAMEPIVVDNSAEVFHVGRHDYPNDGDVKSLSSVEGLDKFTWHPDHLWVFVQPRVV